MTIVKFGMEHPTLIMIQENQFKGPCEGHVLAISRKRGLWDTPRIVKFGMEHPTLIMIQEEPI